MKFIWVTITFSVLGLNVFSQNYTRDAGMRFGNGVTFSFRQFTKEDVAAELFLNYHQGGIRIGGLKQNFLPALSKYSDQFKFYYGFGVHGGISYTNQYTVFNKVYKHDWTFSPLFGMDGIIGLEYYFYDVPLMVSTEMRPYFEFSTVQYFSMRPLNMSVSVKYRF